MPRKIDSEEEMRKFLYGAQLQANVDNESLDAQMSNPDQLNFICTDINRALAKLDLTDKKTASLFFSTKYPVYGGWARGEDAKVSDWSMGQHFKESERFKNALLEKCSKYADIFPFTPRERFIYVCQQFVKAISGNNQAIIAERTRDMENAIQTAESEGLKIPPEAKTYLNEFVKKDSGKNNIKYIQKFNDIISALESRNVEDLKKAAGQNRGFGLFKSSGSDAMKEVSQEKIQHDKPGSNLR